MKFFSKKKVLVTHSGRFHADDVFACATLALYFKKNNLSYKIIRTRDPEIINTGDIVFDVGGSYDPENERYDHHQKEGAGARENGIPYASFGLIWKHYGYRVCESEVIVERIDKKLVQPIDALDNGKQISTPLYPEIKNYDLHDIVNRYLPENRNMSDYDKNFIKMVEWAQFVLTSEIKQAQYKIQSEEKVKEFYAKADDKRIILVEEGYAWRDVLNKYPEPLYAILQNIDGTWIVSAVRDDPDSFTNRKNLPASWGGLEKENLQKVTGVSDAIFCHRNLFLAGAKTKEGVLKLAQLAVEN